MKIIFSDHAKKQNIERKIPKKYIFETIKNPQEIKEGFRNRKLRRRRFGDKILEVVMVTEDKKITIITQYWLEKEDVV